MSELEIEKEQLELVVHNLDVSKEELEIACMELEKELENVKEKLQVSDEDVKKCHEVSGLLLHMNYVKYSHFLFFAFSYYLVYISTLYSFIFRV